MTAEIIAVGTELLLGNTVNSNAAALSRELSALGIGVYHHSVVGDNSKRLEEAVQLAKTRADLIITTGGLGPTYDDLTKTVVAECFGKKLVFDENSARRIKDFFKNYHRPMTDNNLQQAYLPEGCTIFQNDFGTAPACAFEVDGIHVMMLPGPPRECEGVFRTCGIPYLQKLSSGVIHSRTLRVFGIGESSLEQQLRPLMEGLENPTLAPYAKDCEVELRITAKADTVQQAEEMIAPVEKQVRQELGDAIYTVDTPSMEYALVKKLQEKGCTLTTAESCTGGLLAKLLTDVSGSSAVFPGGVVTYSNAMKEKALGVSPALLEEFGAVSPEVAAAMAEGARERMGTDYALSVTGVAGPESDERGNPVGLVFIGLAGEGGTQVSKLQYVSGRGRVRTMAAMRAMFLLLKTFID